MISSRGILALPRTSSKRGLGSVGLACVCEFRPLIFFDAGANAKANLMESYLQKWHEPNATLPRAFALALDARSP